MGERTNISWTDATWNPTRGCSRVSPGCDNCYAIRQARRQNAPGKPFAGLTTVRNGRLDWSGEVMLVPEALELPLRWRRPRRIFTCSMSDLFHPKVPFDFIDRVFAVMAVATGHTFQILTKRPERMAEYLSDPSVGARVFTRIPSLVHAPTGAAARYTRWTALEHKDGGIRVRDVRLRWPLANVWLGTSVEDQAAADARIPELMQCPAAVRFVSCEPLLGPIDLHAIPWAGGTFVDVLTGRGDVAPIGRMLTWVIVGGESGPMYRFMDLAWARILREQCVASGVAFFYKQSGGRFAGRYDTLDGREWKEFPLAETVVV